MKKRILSLALAMVMVVSMAIPAFAAETKNVKISADYNGDGKVDFSYVIPGVIKTEKMQTADSSKWSFGYNKAGKEVNVYTITVGTKIGVGGISGGLNGAKLEYKNGKLEAPNVGLDWDTTTKNEFNIIDVLQPNGWYYPTYTSNSYCSIIKEGYYLIQAYPMESPYQKKGAEIAGYTYLENDRSHGSAILHVVKDGDATVTSAQKGTAENPYKFNDIPKSWIKEVRTGNAVIGYTVTVPNNKTASFAISGTQFESVKVKDKDGKNGDIVKLTSGKQKTIKNVTALSLTLRKTGK